MQWIPCSMVKCIPIKRSVFHEAWLNGSRLNAVYSMQCGAMDPDYMQWSPCSEAQCIPIECSGLYAAWPKASRLNAKKRKENHRPISLVNVYKVIQPYTQTTDGK